jgi:hypothetical protein
VFASTADSLQQCCACVSPAPKTSDTGKVTENDGQMEIETKAPNCPFPVQAAGHSFPPRTCRCPGWAAPAESQPRCGHSALGGLHVYLSHLSRRVWEEALQGGSWVTISVFICACVYMLFKRFIAATASGLEPCSLAAACKDSLAVLV